MQNSNGGKVSSYLQIVCSLLQHNAELAIAKQAVENCPKI